MKLITSTVLFLFIVIKISFSQDLPQAFQFSEDSLRLIRGGVESTGFYDEANIDTIYLEFDQTNYWQQMVGNWENKIDIPATMTFNGVVYDSVGARFRGQTSYMFIQSSEKKSFNITMDYVFDDQNVGGYETLNLINGYDDRSFLRETLYHNLCRNHIPNAKANFVQLYINNENWGIYINVQQLNGQHAEEWFLDKGATRWRAEKLSGGGGGNFGAGFCSLNYLGDDTTTYQDYYRLKSASKPNPWDDLVKACDVLNNTPLDVLEDSLNKYMDVDGALWFVAHEILFTDDDSYVHKGGMDYYVYFDVATNRLVPMEYDANTCMQINDATQWSPFYHENNIKYPLMNVLFDVPELRQRYLAHVRTIMKHSFDIEMAEEKVDTYAALIDQHVSDDPKKLYSYNQFLNEVDEVKDFFTVRKNYVSNNTEVNREDLKIDEVSWNVDGVNFGQPDSSQLVVVNAMVEGEPGVDKVQLYFGTGFMGQFNKTEMFDDGQHNDGQAGDNIFGASIPSHPMAEFVRFYIEAIADDDWGTTSYNPEGAEHDVYLYQVETSVLEYSDVVINELMADNVAAVPDPAGEFDDWIELFNKSAEAIDLSGYFLSDRLDELTKWQFPEASTIEGNGYLIVWADKDEDQEGLHANFKLSKDGETVYFSNADSEIANEVSFGNYGSDYAFARRPNGTGDFVWQEHTFAGPNSTTSIQNTVIESPFKYYPNPAKNQLTLELNSKSEANVVVYSLLGQKIFDDFIIGKKQINTSNWQGGIYFVGVEGSKLSKLIIR